MKEKKVLQKFRNRPIRNKKLIMALIFLSGVLLIVTSYAWFSASLNVKVKFFNLVVSTDNGLFISLDGENFSDSVEISIDSVIYDLKKNYPNHTNQWASLGLWPVSTTGISSTNNSKYDIYYGGISRYKWKTDAPRYLTTKLLDEDEPSITKPYIAFDIFLKNVSGSPNEDNLYIDEGTAIEFDEGLIDETKEAMANIMNSVRFGFLKIGSVGSKVDRNTIQNIKCNNICSSVIYEPNSKVHSLGSIESAAEHGITLIDGVYAPTYASIKAGAKLNHTNGHEGSAFPLDAEHFQLQKTIDGIEDPIFKIPDGFTKMRIYVWIEGQDIDSLETRSEGAPVYLAINFVKDLAGYY